MNREISLALNYALSRGFQIHPDALKILEGVDASQLGRIIKEIVREKARQKVYLIGQTDLEEFLGISKAELRADYEVLSDPTGGITSAEGVDGYNALFASRFSKLKGIMADRPESKMIKSIASIKGTKFNKDIYIWGLIYEKNSGKDVVRLTLDDASGSVEVAVFDRDLRKVADSLLNDQFVMAKIAVGKNGGFVTKELIVPDIPDHRPNRSESEAHAVFLSDLHIGSKYFMEEEFAAFVSWLSSPDPIARKIAFIIIGGDLVDGVGIYKDQDRELVCQTIEEQLQKAHDILLGIPDHIRVFVIPGNHDPGRRALPQPAIPKKHCPGLWERENFVMIGNPARISLNGVKVTVFHGQSIDDIVKTTPGLSYAKPVDVMRHLLKARHLSPIFGSQTPIAPELEDVMVIDEIPDIFHVGHVHITELDMYRNILLVNSGAWQRQTPFQVSVGQVPTPGFAVIVNLNSLKVFLKDFKD